MSEARKKRNEELERGGGVAFPQALTMSQITGNVIDSENSYPGNGGMTLRDYFAGKALAGLLAKGGVWNPLTDLADDAYSIADVMLKARAKQ